MIGDRVVRNIFRSDRPRRGRSRPPINVDQRRNGPARSVGYAGARSRFGRQSTRGLRSQPFPCFRAAVVREMPNISESLRSECSAAGAFAVPM